MKTKGIFGVSAVLIFVCSAATAATLAESDLYGAGEVRAPFLSRGIGARPVGMGEAFVAVADDASALSWNPGGLGRLAAPSGVLVYDSMGEDMGLTYVAGAMPLGPGVAGIGLTALSYGSLELRDASGVKTGTENPMDIAVAAAYAIANPWGKGYGGVALEFVNEDVDGAMVCVSLGSFTPITDKLNAGIALLHLGPSKDGFAPPSQLRLGGSYQAMPELNVALDASFGLVDEVTWLGLGAEYAVHRFAVARAGYKLDVEGQGIDGLTGVTLGLGARFKQFSLDYAYQPFGDLADAHRIGLTYSGISPAR